jgi:Domain of unknown function (DUF4350)
MNWSTKVSLLIDESHNNLISLDTPEFAEFFELLKSKGYEVHQSDSNQRLTKFSLNSIRTLLIGVPQNSFYLHDEIQTILSFVRKGGSLIILHRYGGDLIQRTNLNDLSSHFGIYFENALIKSSNNGGLDSLPILNQFHANTLVDNISKIIFPGMCSLRLSKEAHELCHTDENCWIEIFNSHSYEWMEYADSSNLPLVAYSIYGQGRVISIGTPDFLSNNPRFGINSLDNKQFCLNILTWLFNPVSNLEIRDWMLQQIGTLTEEVNSLKTIVTQVKSSMDNVEHKMGEMESKYYALGGIHLPPSQEIKQDFRIDGIKEEEQK